jgi:hypothetical protein
VGIVGDFNQHQIPATRRLYPRSNSAQPHTGHGTQLAGIVGANCHLNDTA